VAREKGEYIVHWPGVSAREVDTTGSLIWAMMTHDARYDSECPMCDEEIVEGDTLFYNYELKEWCCRECRASDE
jgi:hypothetical protein